MRKRSQYINKVLFLVIIIDPSISIHALFCEENSLRIPQYSIKLLCTSNWPQILSAIKSSCWHCQPAATSCMPGTPSNTAVYLRQSHGVKPDTIDFRSERKQCHLSRSPSPNGVSQLNSCNLIVSERAEWAVITRPLYHKQ